jgi:hypothetical protein
MQWAPDRGAGSDDTVLRVQLPSPQKTIYPNGQWRVPPARCEPRRNWTVAELTVACRNNSSVA